ncbi:MAG: two-component sensor histidine kinase [Gammaproteobacteria bacterium]|nr:two-component sensor histidine kinase [Gammaproteobacteria bacterium]
MAISYYMDSKDIHDYFDHQLQETSHFLSAILIPYDHTKDQLKNIQNVINERHVYVEKNPHALRFHNKFQLQIWNQKGEVLLHSTNAPKNLLTTQLGFSTKIIHHEFWRIYAHYNPNSKLTITVAEPFNFRRQLEKHIITNIFIILLWIYPLFILLIWISIHLSLKKLDEITQFISAKRSTDFAPINIKNIPQEIDPLIVELNHLFVRLEETFERNQRFAADAAHELRTPLAALKTQIQVALLAHEHERKTMFDKIVLGINRCTHVVQQLLALSKLDQKTALEKHLVNLNGVATDISAQLAPLALEKQIDFELIKPRLKKEKIEVYGNETTLGILIRNLLDNAIRYTPKKGKVTLEIIKVKNHPIIRVIDTGPGIPPKLRKQIFERFYRILGTKTTGSGLGLAIAAEIAKLHDAKIKLKTPKTKKGLIVEVVFPKSI